MPCLQECAWPQTVPLLNTPLRQMSELFTDLAAVVVGYRRDGNLVAAAPDDQLFAGDEVYVCAETSELERTMSLFGKERVPCSKLIIVGAGRVGTEISRQLDRLPRRTGVKLIEMDRKRAELAAENLGRRVILNGDGLNREILEEAGIASADAILAVTQDDKTNLLVATRAKRMSEKLTAVSLVNEPSLAPLINQLSIDAMIDPRDTTVSSILPRIRMKQITRVGFIGDSEAELVESYHRRRGPNCRKDNSECRPSGGRNGQRNFGLETRPSECSPTRGCGKEIRSHSLHCRQMCLSCLNCLDPMRRKAEFPILAVTVFSVWHSDVRPGAGRIGR